MKNTTIANILRSTLMVITYILIASAQDAKWTKVRPGGEEFEVEMPGLPSRGTVIISGETKSELAPNIYDLTINRLRFQILSFQGAYPVSTAHDFDLFAERFQRAFVAADDRRNSISFEKNVELKGQSVPQFRIGVGNYNGLVRLYHSKHYFYAVIVVGGDQSDAVVNRVITSFKVRELNEQWPDESTASGSQADDPPDPWSGSAPANATPIEVGILNGKTIKFPAPKYPEAARESRASGEVIVKVVVDEQGKVISAMAYKGPTVFREAATKAAWNARFSQTRQMGRAVKITGILVYRFVYGP